MQPEVKFHQPERQCDAEALEERNARHERRRILHHECKVQIKMIIRCDSVLSGDSSTNAIEVKGRLLDLGIEGAILHTKEDFEPKQALQLTIFLPGCPAVAVDASVRQSQPLPDKEGHFACVVRFVDLAKQGRRTIHSFLKSLNGSARN